MMNELEIKTILIERGYPESAAISVAQKLATLKGKLKEAASEWLSTGEEAEVASNGYSTKSLMEKYPGMTYPAALLTIDWFEREPDKAKPIIEKGIR